MHYPQNYFKYFFVQIGVHFVNSWCAKKVWKAHGLSFGVSVTDVLRGWQAFTGFSSFIFVSVCHVLFLGGILILFSLRNSVS
jgi:hypothetical protein